MTNIVLRDPEQEALAMLIEQFKSKPNIEDFIGIFTDQYAEAEEILFQLLTERLLDTAIGKQLDNWGLDVGELRKGRDDEAYRKAIRIRVAINTSNSTEPVVTEIGKLLTNATRFATTDIYPASLSLYTDGTEVSDDILAEFLKIVAAGVGPLAFEFSYGEAPFVFEGDSTGEGFGVGVLVDRKLIGDPVIDALKFEVDSVLLSPTIANIDTTRKLINEEQYLANTSTPNDFTRDIFFNQLQAYLNYARDSLANDAGFNATANTAVTALETGSHTYLEHRNASVLVKYLNDTTTREAYQARIDAAVPLT